MSIPGMTLSIYMSIGMRMSMHGMTLSICEYRDEDDYTWDDIVCI